jgi:hypothetical protein
LEEECGRLTKRRDRLSNKIEAGKNRPVFKEKYEQELLRHQKLTQRLMAIGKTETIDYELLFKDFWGDMPSRDKADNFVLRSIID